ncbi:single-stranded-DNA-specific exonuclease RecJ [Microvirga lotononidis]|uniref:Single-stranded-DNA-specific exonuclease RecJ n=1 Tax=Microvirga lotononidis TaxID=864069 RepID=I4YY17_9HYPH|nr:single-stranded-DNA-specific exonuclease RecJ [Microvirga lotononidis]EIM28859.1 single-stranded-DNA-specific exonuclease RecJ [Microvirga lotononidis]WQO26781.1 single-stranded-DNA-specific exonuclease RecJ [Microvirga lotononidis]
MTESSPLQLPKPFLGVSNSALGRTWVERCDAAQGTIALAIAQTHGLPDVLSRVLAGRGVGIHETERFLNPRLRDLMPDPHGLTDMEIAASRLADSVQRNEKVAIFGDYDVDGACSAALLAEYLRACGLDYAIHIPDRITEGYGPNVDAIRALKQQGADLLVTVDCGTASIEPLAEAKRLGLDPIVLDHHQAPEQLPDARAVVNPNRQDDLSGLGYLCAAGVVFLFLVALNRTLRSRGFFQGRAEPDLMGSLDLVALATVADVVPLIGLNRAFVRQGLAIMKSRRRVGLAALLDTAGLAGAPESWHLGYLVGPRINAGGRIGDAALGSRLLLTEDPVQAGRLAAELDRLNRERQAIEVVAVAEAEAQAMMALERVPDMPVLVTASAEWHPGVVGLISARTKERFRRPAFAFTLNPDGTATGSGRSVPGVDLGYAVRAAVDTGIAIKGGGHTMAAGVTIQAVDLERFLTFVTDRLTEPVSTMRLRDNFAIDATLTAAGAQPAVVAALERAGPFGQGQPEPVFVFPQHRLVEAREVGSGGHMRVKLRGGDGSVIGGIAFRAAGQPLGIALSQAMGNTLHVAGTLSIDRWGGNEKVEVRIMDAARPE